MLNKLFIKLNKKRNNGIIVYGSCDVAVAKNATIKVKDFKFNLD